jgi:hypothetical protein
MVSTTSFFLCVLLGSLGVSTPFVSAPRTIRNAAFLSWRQHVASSSCAVAPQRVRIPSSSTLWLGTTATADQASQDLITRIIADDELINLSLKLGDIVRDSVFECAKRFQFRPDQVRPRKCVFSSLWKQYANILVSPDIV